MSSPRHWSENDRFWELTYPFDFDQARFAQAPAEVDDVLSLVRLQAPADVLDLCCGPGRHALVLARRGYHVTGVDRTRRYLQIAEEHAAQLGQTIELVCADARDFVRSNSFDLVISLFTSFGYFSASDNLEVLRHAAQSLRPGGQLVIDTLNQSWVIQAKHYTNRRVTDGAVLAENSTVSDDGRSLQSRWTITRAGAPPEVFEFSLALYSATSLKALLAQVGFMRIAAYGGLAGEPYTPNSRRLVVTACK